MKKIGKVIDFNREAVRGSVNLGNGDLIDFCIDNILINELKYYYVGCDVIIETINDKNYLTILNPNEGSSRVIFILLGLFLGLIGVHNFYIGNIKTGLIQLLLNLFLWWTFVIPITLVIWVLIEVCVVDKDSKGRLLN